MGGAVRFLPAVQRVRTFLGGGIGSGKSAAGAVFARLGAAVLSADEAAHAVLEPGGAAAEAVAARWPEALVGGRLDRSRLAGIVFTDEGARAELEAITHPAVAELLAARVEAAERAVVMVEIPLPVALLGPGWRWVVVDVEDEVRLSRLQARGMDPADARRRMAAQPSRQEWLDRADLVIDNSGTQAQLEARCCRAWLIIQAW